MSQDKGLHVKYVVTKVDTGETVNNCFVLRPDKDPAALAALKAYAYMTTNSALAEDIFGWIVSIEKEVTVHEEN
ncbi:hypothetical protein P4S95_27315 [Aneurinibacillus aneurinilyticus]|uniref:hypothetical protein n=1 Tax=Aneurinibacillus aneurinilyticus TaxID=1391 RepID=UPI002E24876E|nr:hypothetical protein [Aneurinibacillus aneurinilyticus]